MQRELTVGRGVSLGLVILWTSFVVAGLCWLADGVMVAPTRLGVNRDKTATSWESSLEGPSQTMQRPSFASGRSFSTEREGFEPSLRE
jgi:hypothetical protein